MKLTIDIDEELYEAYKGKPPMLGDEGMDMIAQAIANGIPYKETISAYEIAGLTEVSRDREMKFKAVRVYRENGPSELNKAFEQGWQFVRASEFIPEHGSRQGYIEYILFKEFN